MTEASLLTRDLADDDRSGYRSPARYRICVLDPADASVAWSALEADGILTPYQRRDWVESFVSQVDYSRGAKLQVLLVQDQTGAPAMVMPFIIEQRGFLRVATTPGGKHANFHMPLFRAPVPRWSDREVMSILAEGARVHGGIDMFMLEHQPITWGGHANPLALRGRPSASNAYKLSLEPCADATVTKVLGKDTRRKLRQKRRRFEGMAPTMHVLARTAEQRRVILDAFYAQKAARMQERGLKDPFADDRVRAFVEEATRLDRSIPPAIDLHALMVGDKVAAMFAGAPGRDRLCGMFNSFDPTPEIARNSPGDLLLIDVIGHYASNGFKTFDLGIGEARYKDMFCDAVEPVVDSLFPLTLRGHLAALAIRTAKDSKRAIKRSPRLMALIRKLPI